MRSHLEEQVADLLDEMKIEYQYESAIPVDWLR